MTVQESGWQEVKFSSLPLPPASLPILAPLTANLSHLVFSFQIIHLIQRMQGNYIHHNWGSKVRSDYPLLLSMAFSYCRQRGKTARTEIHILCMSCADGEETPDKLWTVALFSFLSGSRWRSMSYWPAPLKDAFPLAVIPKGETGSGKRLAALETYQKHLQGRRNIFTIKTFLPLWENLVCLHESVPELFHPPLLNIPGLGRNYYGCSCPHPSAEFSQQKWNKDHC